MATTTIISNIVTCNPSDSRRGGHSYSDWTTGLDYGFMLTDGKEVWIAHFVGMGRGNYVIAAPERREHLEHISWDQVPEKVRRVLFHKLFPEKGEEEENIFALGEEEGSKLNEKLAWAKAHQIGELEDTLALMDKIGRWDSSEFLRRYKVQGMSIRYYEYLVRQGSKKFRVGISSEGYPYASEINEAAEEAARKEYGRKVSSLAKEAMVPWNIASLLSDIDGDRETNIAALRAAKAVHNKKLDEETCHELGCGISRRISAIRYLLGEKVSLFRLDGQVKSTRMAYYLRGE